MDKLNCQKIRDLLVDYADGQLDDNAVSEVDRHLLQCDHCRNTLQNLRKSLSLTQFIWQDNLSSIRDKSTPTGRKSLFQKWLKPIAIAAGLLLITGLYLSFTIPGRGAQELTLEQIEQQIQQNASAARLLAAADMLAEVPDTKSIVQKQYTYILQTYPDSSAAAQAKVRINQL